MDWYQLFGAAGLGSLMTTVLSHYLDVNKTDREALREKARWYRDNRIRAFGGLIRHLLSLGESSRTTADRRTHHLNSRAIATEAILLIDDDKLSQKAVKVIDQLEKVISLPNGDKKDQERRIFESEASIVIDRLRKYITEQG